MANPGLLPTAYGPRPHRSRHIAVEFQPQRPGSWLWQKVCATIADRACKVM